MSCSVYFPLGLSFVILKEKKTMDTTYFSTCKDVKSMWLINSNEIASLASFSLSIGIE